MDAVNHSIDGIRIVRDYCAIEIEFGQHRLDCCVSGMTIKLSGNDAAAADLPVHKFGTKSRARDPMHAPATLSVSHFA